MKRYPKSKPEEPITVERISGVEMMAPLALMPGETQIVKLSISRLKGDPEVVEWSAAYLLEGEVIEVEW